jgi:hypothetical protein
MLRTVALLLLLVATPAIAQQGFAPSSDGCPRFNAMNKADINAYLSSNPADSKCVAAAQSSLSSAPPGPSTQAPMFVQPTYQSDITHAAPK